MKARSIGFLVAVAALTGCGTTLTGAPLAPTMTNQIVIRQAPFTPDSGSIAILCGKLIDGSGAAPLERALVVIRDGRVTSVTGGASRNAAAGTYLPVLNLGDYSCLPGLIDMHTHLTDRPEDTADLTVYFRRTADETLRMSRENAAATLLAGFTSVRNVGTYVLGADTELRDMINPGTRSGRGCRPVART